jgi:hypothetical protein
MYLCVRSIDFSSLYHTFLFDIEIVPTMWYLLFVGFFSFFSLIIRCCVSSIGSRLVVEL